MRTLVLLVVCLLASCAGPQPPDGPPAYSEPPAVATRGLLTVSAAADIPMSRERFRAFLDEATLTAFLEPTENISNPVDGRVVRGTWPEPGAARWLKLDDGHYIMERVVENEPQLFRYQIWIFTNSVGQGVEQIVGEQRFIALGPSQTRFEWDYNVKPRSPIAAIFVRRRLAEIEDYIQTGTAKMAEAAQLRAREAD